jgi:hypothetical protein
MGRAYQGERRDRGMIIGAIQPASDCKRAKVVGQCTCDCGQAQVGLSAHP